jgi:hypothetical protein
MGICVRPIDLGSESQELVDVLQTNLPHLPHARLYPWLYLQNPQGQALAWAAIDLDSRRMLGVAAAFPREIYSDGVEKRGYLLGDFCMDASYRSLGAATALQRACLKDLTERGADFVFDFPSQAMLAVYKRLRITENGAMVRYAKPLRTDRKVAEHVPVPVVAQALSAVANAGLRLRDRTPSTTEWTIAGDGGPWAEEFTAATRKWSAAPGICVARTAAYLNWRYREHPLQQYRMVTARSAGSLAGYLIYHQSGESCIIDDLQGENPPVRKALLSEATALARKMQAHTLSAPWLSTHSTGKDLRDCGFRPRESSSVITISLQQGTVEAQIGEWHLTHGDWES